MTNTKVIAQRPSVSVAVRFTLVFLAVFSLLFVVLRPGFDAVLEEVIKEERKRSGEVR